MRRRSFFKRMREKERTYEGRDETRTTANKKKKRKKEAESKQDVLARVILAFSSQGLYSKEVYVCNTQEKKRVSRFLSGWGTWEAASCTEQYEPRQSFPLLFQPNRSIDRTWETLQDSLQVNGKKNKKVKDRKGLSWLRRMPFHLFTSMFSIWKTCSGRGPSQGIRLQLYGERKTWKLIPYVMSSGSSKFIAIFFQWFANLNFRLSSSCLWQRVARLSKPFQCQMEKNMVSKSISRVLCNVILKCHVSFQMSGISLLIWLISQRQKIAFPWTLKYIMMMTTLGIEHTYNLFIIKRWKTHALCQEERKR